MALLEQLGLPRKAIGVGFWGRGAAAFARLGLCHCADGTRSCAFDIDMQHCPTCGAGELKIIAAILERAVI